MRIYYRDPNSITVFKMIQNILIIILSWLLLDKILYIYIYIYIVIKSTVVISVPLYMRLGILWYLMSSYIVSMIVYIVTLNTCLYEYGYDNCCIGLHC
jgi:hypothetical protein